MSDNLNKRTTSHAKTLDLDENKTALERARALKDAFNGTKAAHEHAREPEKTHLPAPGERTTSFAKTLDADAHKTVFERALSLKAQFERAKDAPEHAREHEKTRLPEIGGGPSYGPKPEPHLRPEGEIRRTVDKQIDKEQREKARQRAKELMHAYKEDHEQKQKTLGLDNDRHKSRHLGR